MLSLFTELRRRNVFKVAAAYAVVGWLLVQIADVFFPALQLPEWTVTFVAALVILGFPVALLLSWAYDLTPAGLKRTGNLPHDQRIVHVTDRRLNYVFAGVIAGAVIGSGSVWFLRQDDDAERARQELIPTIQRLIEENNYPAAFARAEEAIRYIPEDPVLAELLIEVSVDTSVSTTPPGADAYVRPYADVEGAWTHLGRTSIDAVRLPRTLLRWRIEMQGYEPAEGIYYPGRRPLQVELQSVGSVPSDMVQVPSSSLGLTLSGYDYQEVTLSPAYYIDRYEVTNREFKEFMDAGGYENREYWPHDFLDDDETISWKEAMARFRDSTGRPGPSAWRAGTYDANEADYPVRGVSWYEAAAYAEFRGKQLPTVYHWLGAAGIANAGDIAPMATFDASESTAVGSSQAMSPFGSYDMIGNVKEWAWNESGNRRYILGGGFQEPPYVFSYPEARAPMDRSAMNGFRCVEYVDRSSVDDSFFAEIELPNVSNEYLENQEPVDEQTFRVLLSQYEYDDRPLNVAVDRDVQETAYWRRERVTFDTAYGDERMDAYIYLPIGVDPPFQTIIIFPSTTSTTGVSFEDDEARMLGAFDFVLQSGRAAAFPMIKSTYNRRDELESTVPDDSVGYSNHVIQWTNDFRRTVDYLATRDDIDIERLAYYGFSWGARLGAIIPAVEGRLKTAVLLAGGLSLTAARPEARQHNFAPRVTIPILMLNGRHDFIFPPNSSQQRLFELIGSQAGDKRHVIYEGTGHANFPFAPMRQEILGWLDRYLEQVN